MTISSNDARSWASPGPQDIAQRTYDSVKAALLNSPHLGSLEYEVFLQGSYANSTNTRSDSDVDVVVMLISTYVPDTRLLSQAERVHFEARRTPGTTTPTQFRDMVQGALTDHYGHDRVISKNKCLFIPKSAGYLDADVVPSFQVQRFLNYPAVGEAQFIEGIRISPLQGEPIVNYPKEHKKNGSQKNRLANELYKPTVRQLKRLRSLAVDQGLLDYEDAPGYVIECLVHNVPNELFITDDLLRLKKVIAWLSSLTAEELAEKFWSCDQIHHLFQDDPGKHNQYGVKRALDTMKGLL